MNIYFLEYSTCILGVVGRELIMLINIMKIHGIAFLRVAATEFPGYKVWYIEPET